MDLQTLTVAISAASFLVSGFAAYISRKNAVENGSLQQRLKTQDAAYAKKRFIVDLWEKLCEVRAVQKHPDKGYDEAVVLNDLNILELVAIAWTNELVDKHTLALAFANNYTQRFVEIQAIQDPLPHCRKTGPELLSGRQIVGLVNSELTEWLNSRARPLP